MPFMRVYPCIRYSFRSRDLFYYETRLDAESRDGGFDCLFISASTAASTPPAEKAVVEPPKAKIGDISSIETACRV